MDTTIIIAGAAVLVAVVALAAWAVTRRRKRRALRERFGPEYERTVAAADRRRDAERQLQEREQRRERFDIRPLTEEQRARHRDRWTAVQRDFVDDPVGAVDRADRLIQDVMAERGYPVEDFDRRAEDLSVDHPEVVQDYREGHRLATASRDGFATTEDLREAMLRHRRLFDRLVGDGPERPVASAGERQGGR